MNKNRFLMSLLLAVVVTLVMGSCQNDIEIMSGDYTYYTSGEVVRYGSVDTVTISLPDESGQLRMLNAHNGDSVLLVFTSLTGNAYTAHAAVDGKELYIKPFNRTIALAGLGYDIMVSGSGHLYDRTLVMDLQYKGTELNGDNTIEGDGIRCVAKRN